MYPAPYLRGPRNQRLQCDNSKVSAGTTLMWPVMDSWGNLDRAMRQSTPSDVNMQLICNHEE